MDNIEVAKYRITGLVETTDEHGTPTGALEVGSVQELPLEVGSKCIDAGTCELFVDETADEEAGEGETGEVGETGEEGLE